jgi:alpha-D-xyloside xylohydrolase
MKTHVSTDNNILFWRLNGEILKVEPWGPDGVRVRATNLSDFPAIPGALLESPATPEVAVAFLDGKGILTNGKLRAEIWPDGTLHFFNAKSEAVLLEEPEPIFTAGRAYLWSGSAPARPAG